MTRSFISLREMYGQIPSPTYAELDSTFHWALSQLGWKEKHRLDADGKVFVKMERDKG